MAETVHEPRQQRAIEKKNRIIWAGFELFAKKGYFNTNPADIAAEAGVSTGTLYRYFRNKRDILLEVLGIYVDNVFNPALEMIDGMRRPLNFGDVLPELIETAVRAHREYAAIHEALHSLTPTDKLVEARFMALEGEMTEKIVRKLTSLGYEKENLTERVHLAIETIQSYSHERVFDEHPYIDYEKMRAMVTEMLLTLFVD